MNENPNISVVPDNQTSEVKSSSVPGKETREALKKSAREIVAGVSASPLITLPSAAAEKVINLMDKIKLSGGGKNE